MKHKTEPDNQHSKVISKNISEYNLSKKEAYSCYFEIQLEPSNFGKKRQIHNKICNQLLLEQLIELNKEGIQLYEVASNEKLIAKIISSPEKAPHKSLTWEHCSTSTVIGGREGVMRLVPKEQHNARSEYWRTIHPDYKNRGGYHEWAVPNGAPVDKPNSYPSQIRKNSISKLKSEELSVAFLLAVKTNSYSRFKLLLQHAENLAISKHDLDIILTQNFSVGARGKSETLLHLAVANGQMRFIDDLLQYFSKTPNFLNRTNFRDNTPAHTAAENNRQLVVNSLARMRADLTIKNKKKETVFDIVQTIKYAARSAYNQPTISFEASSEMEEITSHSASSKNKTVTNQKPENSTKPIRDPQFVYGDRINKRSTASKAKNGQEKTITAPLLGPYKTYKERVNFQEKTLILPLLGPHRTYKERVNFQENTIIPPLLGPRRTYKERINFQEKNIILPLLSPRKTYKERVNHTKTSDNLQPDSKGANAPEKTSKTALPVRMTMFKELDSKNQKAPLSSKQSNSSSVPKSTSALTEKQSLQKIQKLQQEQKQRLLLQSTQTQQQAQPQKVQQQVQPVAKQSMKPQLSLQDQKQTAQQQTKQTAQQPPIQQRQQQQPQVQQRQQH